MTNPGSIGSSGLAVTIASGTSLSPAVPLGLNTAVGILMSAAWDAAALTFQGSVDGTNFAELVDSAGAAITIATPAAAKLIVLDPAKLWRGLQAIKLRSGTVASAVNQNADRALVVLAVPLLAS